MPTHVTITVVSDWRSCLLGHHISILAPTGSLDVLLGCFRYSLLNAILSGISQANTTPGRERWVGRSRGLRGGGDIEAEAAAESQEDSG